MSFGVQLKASQISKSWPKLGVLKPFSSWRMNCLETPKLFPTCSSVKPWAVLIMRMFSPTFKQITSSLIVMMFVKIDDYCNIAYKICDNCNKFKYFHLFTSFQGLTKSWNRVIIFKGWGLSPRSPIWTSQASPLWTLLSWLWR